jgi:hypothetical protein
MHWDGVQKKRRRTKINKSRKYTGKNSRYKNYGIQRVNRTQTDTSEATARD